MQKQWRLFTQLLWPDTRTDENQAPLINVRKYNECTYLFPYQHPGNQHLIRSNKYKADYNSAKLLAAVLDTHLRSYGDVTLTIIPIPSSTRRWRERGYYHLHTILKYSAFHQYVRTNIVKKSTHTAPQTHVTRQQRVLQQQGSFSCDTTKASTLTGVVILFDDVITTGATMQAARATLAPHLPTQATLVALALAH